MERKLGRFAFHGGVAVRDATRDQDQEGTPVAVMAPGAYKISEDSQGMHVHSGSDHVASFWGGRFSAVTGNDGSLEIRRVGEALDPGAKRQPERAGDRAYAAMPLGRGDSLPGRLAALNAANRRRFAGGA